MCVYAYINVCLWTTVRAVLHHFDLACVSVSISIIEPIQPSGNSSI